MQATGGLDASTAHYVPIVDAKAEAAQRALRSSFLQNWLAQLESLIRKCAMMLWHNMGMTLSILFSPSVFVLILYVRASRLRQGWPLIATSALVRQPELRQCSLQRGKRRKICSI